MSAILGVLVIKEENITKLLDAESMAASINMLIPQQSIEKEEGEQTIDFLAFEMETVPASTQKTPMEIYDSMSYEERSNALYAGTLHMEYSGYYTYSGERLSKGKGAQYYHGHKETYYSQRVLPGTSLNIPGRHVADDGTIRDGDGFICVAADPGFLGRGSVIMTSVGPAKVYDSGCAYGVIDIYVNW